MVFVFWIVAWIISFEVTLLTCVYIYILYVFRLNVLPRFCLVLEKQRSECGMDAVTGNRSLWPLFGGTIQHHCITMIVSWLIPTRASFIMQRWSFRPLASASRRAHSSPVDKCRTSGLNIYIYYHQISEESNCQAQAMQFRPILLPSRLLWSSLLFWFPNSPQIQCIRF